MKQIRAEMDRQDALKCFGCCPGERTFTNDWSFWHGFDSTTDANAHGKSDRLRKARHGQGCGGSLEWIAILRERRSRMNRIVAERKSALQARIDAKREAPKVIQPVESCAKVSACKQHMTKNFRYIRRSKTRPCIKQKSTRQNHDIQEIQSFDVAKNKCFQRAILSLAASLHSQVHDVLQRMFRASITNDAPTGHGVARESVENLYATENALRHIGAYILVFETSKANFPDSFDSLRCYRFGSCQGYMLGFVEWNEKEHHALINTQRNLATKAELISENHFAPWDLGYVGSSKSSSSSSA